MRQLREANRFLTRFGARKMWIFLRSQGHDVARCTIERLYRAQGWQGATRRRRFKPMPSDGTCTTIDPDSPPEPPNQVSGHAGAVQSATPTTSAPVEPPNAPRARGRPCPSASPNNSSPTATNRSPSPSRPNGCSHSGSRLPSMSVLPSGPKPSTISPAPSNDWKPRRTSSSKPTSPTPSTYRR
ncbi:IS3 family transposase [Helcobacillus massiliensis]|uniref:IS3 family transposase n=1 Tax=Helcobacillus massiliensis TaxID=521392 RepID=UPI00161D3D90